MMLFRDSTQAAIGSKRIDLTIAGFVRIAAGRLDAVPQYLRLGAQGIASTILALAHDAVIQSRLVLR